MTDFQSSSNNCEQLLFRPITVDELASISAQLTAAGLCTMLVWATNNGVPTLVYFIPGSEPVIVPTPSLLCPAYYFCAAPIE